MKIFDWILRIAALAAILALLYWFCLYELHAEQQPIFIPPIEQVVRGLQHRVGAKEDGIIGPETMRLVNAAVKAEQKEKFNQYAEVFMTENGGPRK